LGGLQPILVIVSRELKLDKEMEEYFDRRGMGVRVVSPLGAYAPSFA
jgi:hypothetical protein